VQLIPQSFFCISVYCFELDLLSTAVFSTRKYKATTAHGFQRSHSALNLNYVLSCQVLASRELDSLSLSLLLC